MTPILFPMRLLLSCVVLSFFVARAPAQSSPWLGDDDRPRRRDDTAAKAREAAIPPLSPNPILGRVQWADDKAGIVMLRLDRLPEDAAAVLVARTDDCTPCALLTPLSPDRRAGIVACRVTRGAARPGMEVVLPGATLLKQCVAGLRDRSKRVVSPATAKAVPCLRRSGSK